MAAPGNDRQRRIDARESYSIAHRGLSEQHPENTLASFQAAIDHRADVLEVDVRVTADGVLVCVHDATLERCHGHDAAVGDLTWQQLHELAPEVPTLRHVLLRLGPRAGWFLDCKFDDAGALQHLVRVLQQTGMGFESGAHLRAGERLPPGTVAFESARPQLLRAFRALTGVGCVRLVDVDATLRDLLAGAPMVRRYAQGLVVPDSLASARVIRYLRRLGLGVYVYTVNDGGRFDDLRAMGASGVFTDAAHRIA